MKEDIAKRWSAALRSGKYVQQGQYLADSARKKHCCLGVLCELAIEDGVELEAFERGGLMPRTVFSGSESLLPGAVQGWARMASDTGRRLGGSALIVVNDKGGTFNEIADIIDKEWEEL